MRDWERGPIEHALDALATKAAGRTVEAYLEVNGLPIDVSELARHAVITGLDMGIAFAVAFPDAALRVQEVVRLGAELTEADEAQRLLMFVGLVEATR